jgi:pyruvate dehydrogenase E1 component beta subunit
MLMNTPGLQIVTPSTPRDVRGLIRAAVESDDPVVWADHVRLFDVTGDLPDEPETIPLGVADVKRPGRDVTVVGSSLMVQRALGAAGRLAGEGIDVEVVDLRTLVPLDRATILESVGRTHRLVVVDECHRSCGVGAEIAATVAEEAFDDVFGDPRVNAAVGPRGIRA